MTNPHPARAFPERAIIRAARGGRLVVIAPHPDDETLGCGLLLARAIRCGCRIGIVALTDGDASHPASGRWPPAALGRLRRSELRHALARLGAGRARVRFAGWHDGALAAEACPMALRRTLIALGTTIAVVTSPRDHHPDHQAAFRLAAAAVRGTGIGLATYDVWSRADDAAGPRLRSPGVAAKTWAIRAHRSQTSDYITDDPHGFRLTPAVLRRLVAAPERFSAPAAFRPSARAIARH